VKVKGHPPWRCQIPEPIDTNKGVRQGCGLSSESLYTYINKDIEEWKQTAINGIQFIAGKIIQTIFYAHDQVITEKSDDELQKAVNTLNKIITKYDMKIFSPKQKHLESVGEGGGHKKAQIRN
jgi:hypothetical protein